MKKNELIHLHSLLGNVARDLADNDELTEDDLSEYRALGTSPMTMRGSRSEHEEAVCLLASKLAETIEDDSAVESEATGASTASTTAESTEEADERKRGKPVTA